MHPYYWRKNFMDSAINNILHLHCQWLFNIPLAYFVSNNFSQKWYVLWAHGEYITEITRLENKCNTMKQGSYQRIVADSWAWNAPICFRNFKFLIFEVMESLKIRFTWSLKYGLLLSRKFINWSSVFSKNL